MMQQLKVRNMLLVSKVMLNYEEGVVEDGGAADNKESVSGQKGNVKWE